MEGKFFLIDIIIKFIQNIDHEKINWNLRICNVHGLL